MRGYTSPLMRAAIIAASLQLGGQRVDVRARPETNLADTLAQRAAAMLGVSRYLGPGPAGSTRAPNGGGRRKAAMAVKHARKYGHARMGRYHA